MDNEVRKSRITVLLVSSNLAILTMVFCLIFYFNGKSKEGKCTHEVIAKIDSIVEEVREDSYKIKASKFYNVYSYTFNDVVYTEKSGTEKQDKLQFGDTVKIRVNPDNPKEFVDNAEIKKTNVVSVIFLTMSIIFMITFVILLIVFHRLKVKANRDGQKTNRRTKYNRR